MDHQLTRASSGVSVVTEHLPSVRSVTLGMWVRAGSRDEAPHEFGCSHLLEHLLFKGTTSRSAQDIAEELDAIGGEMNAFTSKEETCFYARVLDRDLVVAFDVLADMLVDARNTPEDVDAERQVVLSEIDIHHDSPDELVHADLTGLLLGSHPLALETLGDADSIASMPRDVVDRYYRRRYRPETLTVAAAGHLDHTEVVRLTEELLGDLGRPGGASPERTPPEHYRTGEITVRHRPTEQAHLAIGVPGLPTDDDDRWALRVLSMLLGGGMSSRLFQEVRERRGLAYATYSYVGSYSDAGMFGAYVGTSPARVDEALAVLDAELERVVEDVTAAEVVRARGALTGGTVLGLEDTGARMARLGKQIVAGRPVIPVDEGLARISAVELEDVQRVAKRVLTSPRSLAVVGPFDPEDHERFADILSGSS